jgi:MFS family permease
MTTHQTAVAIPDMACRPASPGDGRKIAAAAWMVTAVFILSNSATPLYVHWQRQFAFSSATSTVIFAAYVAGLLAALLVAGQLSERLGRKAVLVPAFLAAMAACGLFATAGSVAALIAARFLSGAAVGAIVSAGMAAVVDVGGPQRKRQAALAASVAMVLGAGLGPLLAGALAQGMAQPVQAIFGIEFLLLVSALGVAMALPLPAPSPSPSPSPSRSPLPLASPTPGAPASAPSATGLRLPSVPRRNRRDLALGVAVFAPGLAATSFVLSLGPALLARLLHVDSPLVAGGMACLMFMSATGVQFAVRQLPVRTILLLGAAATVLAMGTMIWAVHAAQPALLLAAAVLAGMGQGQGQLGGLTAIGTNVPDRHRAQANALLNIGAYIPAGLLPVGAGYLIDHAGMAAGATTFSLVLMAAAAAGAGFVYLRRLA